MTGEVSFSGAIKTVEKSIPLSLLPVIKGFELITLFQKKVATELSETSVKRMAEQIKKYQEDTKADEQRKIPQKDFDRWVFNRKL